MVHEEEDNGIRPVVSVFPPWSGIRAVMAGSVFLDLKTGKVTLQGQNPDHLSHGLNEIKRSRFRSALIFCDQPSSIKIDGVETFPQVIGLQSIAGVDLNESLEINSYLMQSVSVILSTSERPPVIPDVGTFEFRRAASAAGAHDAAYTSLQLRPINIQYSRGTTPGVPYKDDVFTSVVFGGEEAPHTGMLGRKTFQVRNIGDNPLNFKLQTIMLDGETYDDIPTTGPEGINVDAGDSALVEIDRPYYRIRFVKRALAAATDISVLVRLSARFGNGGG